MLSHRNLELVHSYILLKNRLLPISVAKLFSAKSVSDNSRSKLFIF